MLRWRTDKNPEDADTLEHVQRILDGALAHRGGTST
jgi:hypothetical protein